MESPRLNRRIPVLILPIFLLGLAALACSAIPFGPTKSGTPTRTGQIGAVEQTSTPSADEKKNWQLWQGTITSQTSRQYMTNGSLVNTCNSNWDTSVALTVDPAGSVAGLGYATIKGDVACSPHPVSLSTKVIYAYFAGRKDSSEFTLHMGSQKVEPMPSAEFGGYFLLVGNGACPSAPQDLKIPLTGSTSAAAQLALSGVMSGCGGSKNDIMSNQSQVQLERKGTCADYKPDPTDPNAAVCQ